MSARPLLTADLGNSAAKLALWRDLGAAEPERAVTVPWGTYLDAALVELGAAARVLACGVAGSQRAHELADACARAGLPTPAEPRLDLAIACRDAHTVGRDRLFAARGAWALLAEPALVVDAGTALTVDALGRAPDGAPCFLGGAIAPGPRLLAALARGTAQLFEVRADLRARRSGATPRGARERRDARLPRRGARTRRARRRGGGARGRAAVPDRRAAELLADLAPGRRVVHDPWLVARGLLAAARGEVGA
ncbi:MAG: type III pantothenate kinase [Planctomycetes bacterium]|nr:type III pantothenate kinase [Planctomycetota bacterium]